MVFRFRKKRHIVDLGERYRKQQEKATAIKDEQADSLVSAEPVINSSSNSGGGMFGIFDRSVSSTSDSDNEYVNVSGGVEEKRKKLAKRLLDMTDKIEDLSNQIYHLQQRIEVLERKSGVNNF